jgi:flagellar protein FlaJ
VVHHVWRGWWPVVNIEQAYREMGMPFRDFILRVVLVFFMTLSTIIILWRLFPEWIYGGLLVLLFSIPIYAASVVLAWPAITWEHRGHAIDRDMHLFITRIGTLSTGDTSRQSILELLSKMEGYRELAEEVRKIYKLAEEWHVGLSASCRFIAKQTPSRSFSDFLYRLAHSMEAGDSAEEFFQAEQAVFMDQYSSTYRSSLKTVDVMNEVLMGLIISSLFMMVVVALFPLLTGQDANLLMSVAVLIFLFIEAGFLFFLYAMVPGEQVWYAGPLQTPETIEIRRRMGVSIVLCFLFFFIIIWGTPQLTIPIVIAFTLTPLWYVSIKTNWLEREIKRRDDNFAAFIRTLGSTQEATGKVAVLALKKLSYHEFGPLTDNISALYKRVAMRINRQRAWQLFGAETNSELISKFSEMFSEGTSTGGEPRAISRIISDNFSRLLTLRTEKFQTQGRITGILYGLAAAMTVILYLALYLVEGFFDMFSQVSPVEGFEFVILLKAETFNIEILNILVVFIILIHAVISMFITRVIGGGHWIGGLTHLVGIMWVAAIASFFTKFAIVGLL